MKPRAERRFHGVPSQASRLSDAAVARESFRRGLLERPRIGRVASVPLAQVRHDLARGRGQIGEGAETRGEVADGAAGGGFGNDAGADARLRHAADGVEAAQLNPQAQGLADPRGAWRPGARLTGVPPG